MPGAKVLVEFVGADVGGRESAAHLAESYSPHLRVGSGEYLGVAFAEIAGSSARDGRCVSAEVNFVYAPTVDYGDLAVGAQFQILEGARIVGVGRVVELVP